MILSKNYMTAPCKQLKNILINTNTIFCLQLLSLFHIICLEWMLCVYLFSAIWHYVIIYSRGANSSLWTLSSPLDGFILWWWLFIYLYCHDCFWLCRMQNVVWLKLGVSPITLNRTFWNMKWSGGWYRQNRLWNLWTAPMYVNQPWNLIVT